MENYPPPGNGRGVIGGAHGEEWRLGIFTSVKQGGGISSFAKLGSVAVAAGVLAVPLTAAYVAKTTGATAEALTLANGEPGQTITIALEVDGGADGTLTPATASGFSNIIFADAGDIAALQYVDDTVGWVILGTAGVAAPPVTTA